MRQKEKRRRCQRRSGAPRIAPTLRGTDGSDPFWRCWHGKPLRSTDKAYARPERSQIKIGPAAVTELFHSVWHQPNHSRAATQRPAKAASPPTMVTNSSSRLDIGHPPLPAAGQRRLFSSGRWWGKRSSPGPRRLQGPILELWCGWGVRG